MTLEQWMILTVAGALFGLIGQLVRTAMGLRKLHRETQASDGGFKQAFVMRQFAISLLLGALAGVMAALGLFAAQGGELIAAFKVGGEIPGATITAIMAAGYAGADFLEGIIKSQLKH